MGGLKGQSANELLVIYMFVMLIFTLFVASFTQQRSAEMESSKVMLADSVGEQFASELNLAAKSGSGYSRRIVYPVLLDGVTPYSIIINNISKSIDVQFQMGKANYSHSFPVVSTNVIVQPRVDAVLPNGTAYGYVLHSSTYGFSTGQIYAQNINGMVVLSLSPSYSPNPHKIVMSISGNYTSMGTEFVNITAEVCDTFGSLVPDGTLVHFETFSGIIDDFVPTVNGNATALLTTTATTIVTANVSGASSSITVPYSS
jgi:hypothetical protein